MEAVGVLSGEWKYGHGRPLNDNPRKQILFQLESLKYWLLEWRFGRRFRLEEWRVGKGLSLLRWDSVKN